MSSAQISDHGVVVVNKVGRVDVWTARGWAIGLMILGLFMAACGEGASAGSRRVSTPGAGSCAFSFTNENLAMRAWAFDGTITSIGTLRDSRLGEVSSATFTVNKWFRGGSDRAVTIQFEFPSSEGYGVSPEVGKRFLVSGESRWGGEPLSDPIAWGCGFTREWTESESQSWTSVF